jgi:lysophospholipase L1-like esterase
VNSRDRIKYVRPFLFSTCTVFLFFVFVEMIFRFSGLEPTVRYRTYSIPSWVEEFDPAVLEKYQRFIAEQGFVNEDIYAYKTDLRYGYKLKPNISIKVRNYSSALVVDMLPPWTINSDTAGFRVPLRDESKKETSGKTLHVLGDSSSFGWGVDYEKSYPFVLVDKLSVSSNKNIELRNLSLPGFSSFQGKLLWQDLGNVKKDDWVILSFGWNDSSSSSQTDEHQFESRNSLIGKTNWRMRQFLVYRWMRSWLTHLPEPALTINDEIGKRVPLKQYRKNLEVLVNGIQEKGAKPILVSVCNFAEYQDVARKTAENKKISFYNFPLELEPFLPTVHDRFPDQLVTYFEAYGEQIESDPMLVFLFPDRCHPNEIGHGLMAEVLFESLKGEVQ